MHSHANSLVAVRRIHILKAERDHVRIPHTSIKRSAHFRADAVHNLALCKVYYSTVSVKISICLLSEKYPFDMQITECRHIRSNLAFVCYQKNIHLTCMSPRPHEWSHQLVREPRPATPSPTLVFLPVPDYVDHACRTQRPDLLCRGCPGGEYPELDTSPQPKLPPLPPPLGVDLMVATGTLFIFLVNLFLQTVHCLQSRIRLMARQVNKTRMLVHYKA